MSTTDARAGSADGRAWGARRFSALQVHQWRCGPGSGQLAELAVAQLEPGAEEMVEGDCELEETEPRSEFDYS